MEKENEIHDATNNGCHCLGLANRARKIISGEELAVKEIRSGNAKLVLLSADASANTTKKITDKCHFTSSIIK